MRLERMRSPITPSPPPASRVPGPFTPPVPGPVLLTGSAGRIGTALQRELEGQYAFRGVDMKPTRDVPEALVADLADPEAARKAVAGCWGIVHLAAEPDDGPYYEEIRPRNLDATYNLFEAARQAGVKKIVFASTN